MKELRLPTIWEMSYEFGDEQRDGAVADIAKALGISPIIAVLLYNRGYNTPKSAQSFLHYEETDFYDPFLMKDMDCAVERILTAIDNKEKVYIYGDYDVDGVTSVSMLYLYLSECGCDVKIKIPKRDGEGYGVSSEAVKLIAEDGATLVITVDTGITADAEVEYAASLGVDFVVTDHHECHGELPRAVAVVNPHRPDCTYPFRELAGVGVIFKVICGCEMVRAERAGEARIDGARRICTQYADLVSVGTVADVMPLVDENRLIVSLGLAKLSRREGRAGLCALIDAAGKKSDDGAKKVTSNTVGFCIAPRINAAGRISDALIAAELLLASDSETAARYAERLCEINKQRQAEENNIATEAYAMIEESDTFKNDKVLILESDSWQQGIIGIVSSRITEKYGLPSILISFRGSMDGEPSAWDDGKGSGRSIKGLNLVEALGECEDLLEKYGGHELAAGLTVKRGKIEEFRRRMNEYAEAHMTEEMFNIRVSADCELRASDINMRLADDILELEPFGIGNPMPQFVLRDAMIKKITYIGGGKHTKLSVVKDGATFTAMFFGVGSNAFDFEDGDTVDLLFNIDINDYRGVRSVQLIVHDIRYSESLSEKYVQSKQRYMNICNGGTFGEQDGILPDRDDFARVYTVLRKEFRSGTSTVKTSSILRLVNDGGDEIGYIKLKFILRILDELRICTVEETQNEVYRIDIFFNSSKTSIDRSHILKKLRGQCLGKK